MNDMVECNPISKIDNVISIIIDYNPQITNRKSDYLEVKLISDYGEELWIEIETEFSIFFGDWHCHYYANEEEYQIFLDHLFGILENKKFTICRYKGDQWWGSCLSESDTPNESDLRKEYGDDKTIKCNYWDKTKNIIFPPQV